MPKVGHFEIHADDTARARQFYGNVFGWQFQEWGGIGYYLITAGPDEEPGINGGLLQRPVPVAGQGSNAFICTVNVTNVDESLEKALANGGRLALEKMPVPGIGWLVYCLDTEGNTFGMMQADPTAPVPDM
jgi:predicted enzyme related to lactoylglutathione lyase